MKGIRKVCINNNQIQAAINMNAQLEYEGNFRPRIDIPNPKYQICEYNFRIHNVQSFYCEPNENNETGDIIINLAYDGIIRLEYNPAIIAQLETHFSC